MTSLKRCANCGEWSAIERNGLCFWCFNASVALRAAPASPESAELGLKTTPKSPANPFNDLNISGPSSVQVDQQGDHEPTGERGEL